MLYDDEGYILLTLRNQIEHGGLYDRVYTQYGPFFYAVLGGLSKLLHFEWNNISGRWFTLFNWMTASGLCGLLVWRCRRSVAAVSFVTVSVFATLWIMLQEPVHPGGLITAFVALAALVGSECIRTGRPRVFAISIGAIGACMALTKINAGAFLLIAGGLWLLTSLGGRWQRPALGAALLIAAVVPFALMRPLLDQTWVPTFALLASLGCVSAALVASQRPQNPSCLPLLGWFAASALAATLLVTAWSVAQGTSIHGLFKGVILAPLQHPGIYSFPVRWRPLVIPVSIAGLTLVLAWAWRGRSLPLLHAIAAVRLLAAGGMAVALLPWIGSSQAALALCYGVPLAGVFAISLRNEARSPADCVRVWLALLLALQSLQAFPIAGSQLNWGTFLWVPLMVLGVIDALEFWRDRSRPAWRLCYTTIPALLACALAAVQVNQFARISKARSEDGVPLGLHGAETIVLPAPVASSLHILATNAHEHASMLFSLPGFFSFNEWSRQPTPTLRNVTHWFSLLSDIEQQEIITAMSAEPRAAFILQRPLIAYLADHGYNVRGPLVAYLRNNYHPAIQIDGFSLWVKQGREIPPYSVATWEMSSTQPRLAINLPPVSEPIARLVATYHDDSGIPDPSATDGRTSLNSRIQPLDAVGSPVAADTPVSWPLPPGGPRRLTFNFTPPNHPAKERYWVFRFEAEDGRTLGFARFGDQR